MAQAALSEDLDHETKKVVWRLGKLLMFDNVDIADPRGGLVEKVCLLLSA